MKISDQPVQVKQNFGTSIKKLWDALTDRDHMEQWFFENIPAFQPEVGFEIQFNVNTGERNFLHEWRITEVLPHKKIVYNWQYAEYKGESIVTFELTEKDNHVLLLLTHQTTKDFEDEIPELTRESCQAGWNHFISGRLKSYLDKQQ